MEGNRFLNVNDVADYMGVSVPMAYKIIRKLNNELASQGYITVAGRISKAYFSQKIYASQGV